MRSAILLNDGIRNDSELHSFLWDKSSELRGKIDSSSYKNYLFPLIFYKFICDTYDYEYEVALEKTHDIKLASSDLYHRFIIPTENHWKELRNITEDIGQTIDRNLKSIEKANRKTTYSSSDVGILDGIFIEANWGNKNRLPDSLLKNVIESFSTINLSIKSIGNDALGNAYEYLLGQFAEDAGQTAQEFFTNRTLVTLMVDILQPKNGESVYDPTCGTAGMLLMCKKYADANGINSDSLSFYGQDFNELSVAISRMNMIIHDVEDSNIEWADVITNPKFVENDNELKTFNIVLANPPYSITEWNHTLFEKDRFGRNILGVPKTNADFVFIQHILKSMDPENGRAAILLPHGLLSSKAESSLRENLIKSDLLECIIGVSKGLFYNSPMEACVFICRSKKTKEMKGKIKFIDASKQYVKNGNHNDLSPSNIKFISKLYFSKEDVDGYSITVPNENLLKGKYSLTVDGQLSRLEYPDIKSIIDSKESCLKIRKCYHDAFNLIKMEELK